jgi:AraC-like DNA-binding protein
MERIYRIILEQHLRRLNAEVTLAAWSSFAPGFRLERSRPHVYRLVYVTKGTGWVEVNGRRYVARPGTLSLLPAGFELSCGVSGTEPVEAYWVQFDAKLGDAVLINMLKLPACVDAGENPDIVRSFEVMFESSHDSNITSVLRSKAALYEVLACYLGQCRVDEEALANIDPYVKLGKVLDYIDHHLETNLTLEELAKIAYLHPNYFVSLFKNLIGQTPIHYVNMRRLERAKKLLVETDSHVSEIAAAVGMQNHYLSRLFKQHTGVSPMHYRKLFGGRKDGTAHPAWRKEAATGPAGAEMAASDPAVREEAVTGPAGAEMAASDTAVREEAVTAAAGAGGAGYGPGAD